MNQQWEPPKVSPDCTAECPSDLELDTLMLEELQESAADDLHARIRGCTGCEARWRALSGGFDAFPNVDVEALISKIHVGVAENTASQPSEESLPAWVSWLFGVKWVGAAALAAVAIVFVLPEINPPSSPDVVRTKRAGPQVTVYIERDGNVDILTSGAKAYEGDRVRFSLRDIDKGYITILGQEADASVYLLDELELETKQAVATRELPGAYALDASIGTESFIVYHCLSKVAADVLKTLPDLDGCNRYMTSFEKVARE